MTIAQTATPDAEPEIMTGGFEPPVAPLAMPKQTLTREAGPLWRGFAAVFSLLRRDLGRVG